MHVSTLQKLHQKQNTKNKKKTKQKKQEQKLRLDDYQSPRCNYLLLQEIKYFLHMNELKKKNSVGTKGKKLKSLLTALLLRWTMYSYFTTVPGTVHWRECEEGQTVT